jgi:ketosteroid isomerase-like protein
MAAKGAEAAIIGRERELLERWAAGDPAGYTAAMTADGTYFDDIGAMNRLSGGDAIRRYAASLAGQIPAHDYEMVDPHVQLVGDVGILTFRYHPRAPDGTALTPWRATTVYRREGDGWAMVHAHWSMQKAG